MLCDFGCQGLAAPCWSWPTFWSTLPVTVKAFNCRGME